jgi:RNA polymerase sigma-70 factor (ECF subfamily)
MAQLDSSNASRAAGPGVFATTHWSLVLAAADPQAPQAQAALATLCQNYWFPLYAYVRRQGRNPQDAQDLTQEFFARLLASHLVAAADRKRGRFRSFLLASFKHFLMHEWEKGQAHKRGGHCQIIPWEAQAGESRYTLEPADHATADKAFDRRWALVLLEKVVDRLRADYAAGGRAELFDRLKPALTGEKGLPPYAELARRMGLTEGALKVAVHRLRQRYGELLREEIAQTVASPDEIQDELHCLFEALSN